MPRARNPSNMCTGESLNNDWNATAEEAAAAIWGWSFNRFEKLEGSCQWLDAQFRKQSSLNVFCAELTLAMCCQGWRFAAWSWVGLSATMDTEKQHVSPRITCTGWCNRVRHRFHLPAFGSGADMRWQSHQSTVVHAKWTHLPRNVWQGWKTAPCEEASKSKICLCAGKLYLGGKTDRTWSVGNVFGAVWSWEDLRNVPRVLYAAMLGQSWSEETFNRCSVLDLILGWG